MPDRPQMPKNDGENEFTQDFKNRRKLYEKSPEYEAKWQSKIANMPGPIIQFESKQFWRQEPSEWDNPQGKKIWYTVTKATILGLTLR